VDAIAKCFADLLLDYIAGKEEEKNVEVG